MQLSSSSELATADEGHDSALEASAEAAREAAEVLQTREADLSQQTEDVARLAARHSSAERLLQDSRKTLEKSEAEARKARDAVAQSQATLDKAGVDFAAAQLAEANAVTASAAADAAGLVRQTVGVDGWFERVDKGVYALTATGRAGLVHWAHSW